MRYISLFTLLTLFCFACQNSGNQSCCQLEESATTTFAALANDAGFRNAHVLADAIATPDKGKMIRFAVPGADSANAYYVAATQPTQQYLVLFHEWWGLNDFVKREAEQRAEALGMNVIALDLYDGKVATTPDEAGQFMKACNETRARAIIGGAAAWAGPQAEFRTCGWCFGGGWSLQGALALGDRAKACVMYYGMPEKDVEKLKALNCKVLFIHASKDKWINDEVVAGFEKNMSAAGKSLRVERYDADHAFANPSGPRYVETAAKTANMVANDFLKMK